MAASKDQADNLSSSGAPSQSGQLDPSSFPTHLRHPVGRRPRTADFPLEQPATNNSIAEHQNGREDKYVYVSEALLAGIAAGATEAVVCTPFELLKHRRQVSSTSHSRSMGSTKNLIELAPVASKLLPSYNPDLKAWNQTLGVLSTLPEKHSNMAVALKQYPWMLTGSGRPPLASEVKRTADIISLEGWKALWRGLRPGIIRDCVFSGVFFSTWQFFHIGMLNWKALDINPPPRFSFWEPMAFLGGVFAGLLRLDLNEEPLRDWVARTVESSGITVEGGVVEDGLGLEGEDDAPQQIEIE
ncbi:hypothetical protein J5N97_022855 [Dioscorea zingiberensis]|uniref:Uncharacterized protein n=1 Tax=Dioscorea zingiberensis TaxID=325984 RepID=A0A9D5HBD8_9LILI|nr:hypothetical protein J5N97_022855 [Dioscorea zingiberensis]